MGNLWDDVSDFVDRNTYVEALIIILTFTVLAKVVDWVLSGFVRRLASRSNTDFDDNLLKIMHRPIFTTVALIGLILATYSLELNPDVESDTVLIVRTILVIIWLRFGLRLSRLLMGAMRRSDKRFSMVQTGTEPLFKNMAAIIFFLIAVYAILLVWGISVTGLVASAGIVGLALSFAAQDTLSNLFAGAAILADKPYEIDDFIILDSGERGKVTHIGLRSTRLVTRDDVEVSIPQLGDGPHQDRQRGRRAAQPIQNADQRRRCIRLGCRPCDRGPPGGGGPPPQGPAHPGAASAAPRVRRLQPRLRPAVVDRGPSRPGVGHARDQLRDLPPIRRCGHLHPLPTARTSISRKCPPRRRRQHSPAG